MPRKQKSGNHKGKGKAKKKDNQVLNEAELEPFMEVEEGTGTQPEEDQPDAMDEDEEESPALQRIVEFYEAHPYFYNLRHEKYRNTKLKEAKLAVL